MYNDTERILASNVDAFTLYKEWISSLNTKIVYVTKYMMFIGYCTINSTTFPVTIITSIITVNYVQCLYVRNRSLLPNGIL